jgi:hypothetical protein
MLNFLGATLHILALNLNREDNDSPSFCNVTENTRETQ